MSIQFTTPTTYLQRTTGLVQGSAASYSCVCWFRPDQDAVLTAYQTVFSLEDVTQNQWQGIFSDANLSNGSYQLSANNGSLMQTADTILTAGQWYPIGYHRSGTSHSWYVSTNLAASFTLDMSAVTFATLFLGDDTFGANHGTFAYFREWTAILNQQEMRDEACSRTAVRTSGLITDTPLTSDLNDLTSNNNDWSAVGAGFSFIADDPIPAHGTVASDPIAITLPYSTTVNVKPTDVEFIFDWWLTYTAVSPEVYIGGWFFGQLTVGQYRPSTRVFSDAGVTPYPPDNSIDTGTQNKRFQMPVTAGDSYWFHAVANWVTMTSHTLTIDFLTAPIEAVPEGSYFVNDDAEDYYSAVFSSTPGDDYHILRYIPFVITNSETGGDASLANGKLLVINDGTSTVQLFDVDLTFISDTGVPGQLSGGVKQIPDGTAFYVADSTGKQLYRVSDDGAVGGTSWAMGGTRLTSAAVNNDETICYCNTSALTNAPLKQYDLVNSVFLADLVAGIATYFITDIITLSDDSIVVLYTKGNPSSIQLLRYDAAGALLSTYIPGSTGSPGSLSQDFDDPDNYFLMRLQDYGSVIGFSTLFRIKIADGTFTTVTQVIYEAGIYQPDVTATPAAKFGVSSSCPFFPIQFSTPAPTTTQIFPIRRERIFRHLSEEQQWIFYQWLQIDAEAGVGLSEGQGSDPQIILQWSDDGGHTWSNEHFLSAGRMGEYTKRPRTQQIGRSRDRVFKVAMSDPVKWALLSAYFGAEKGTS